MSARSRVTAPTNPETAKIGTNTPSVVSVEPSSAPPTSLVPTSAASHRLSPDSSLFAILSDTTIELSTSRPIASASPAIEMIFSVMSRKNIAANVAVNDTGMLIATISAIRHPPINSSKIRITAPKAISADCARLLTESSINRPSLLST